MVLRFIAYGLIGWCVEVFWTGMGSMLRGDWRLEGSTYLWMLPIYGLAVFLEPLHEGIRQWPWFARGVTWMAVTWILEFLTGGTLELAVGACPWDYTGKTPYSVLGLIRLDYAPAWFVVGLVFERLHDWLRQNLTPSSR